MASPATRRVTISVLFLLTVVLAVTLIIITSVRSGNESANQLAVEDPGKIDYVKISGENEEVVLTRTDRRSWLVNGEESARPSAVNLMLRTLATLEIKSPVSEDYFRQETGKEEVLPVSVEVRGKGRLLTAFRVYLLSGDPDGNIFQKERSEGSFIALLPGYDINPAIQFISESRYWKPFTIFEINPSAILSVEVTRRLPVEESFLIESANGELMLTLNGVEQEVFDTTAVSQYISWFAFVPFERWSAGSEDNAVDSIFSADPVITLRVREQISEEEYEAGRLKGEKLQGEVQHNVGEANTLHIEIDKSVSGHSEGARSNSDVNTGHQNVREHFVRFWRMVNSDGSTDNNRLWGEKNRSGELFVVTYFDIDPVIIRGDKFISD
jgi:hypothetical protein